MKFRDAEVWIQHFVQDPKFSNIISIFLWPSNITLSYLIKHAVILNNRRSIGVQTFTELGLQCVFASWRRIKYKPLEKEEEEECIRITECLPWPYVGLKMAVFWVVAPCRPVEVYRRFKGACCLHHQGDECPDDGGRKHLWNVGKLLPDYTTQQPTTQPSSYWPPWEPEISLV
jgi:hypothetical protein